ncbi:MAG: DNA-processing protein DprA [Ruminococcus sp.]|nr:DNA-processing protein DprA [Ruminococcus sp.]
MDKRAYWIWLLLVFGPASPRLWELGKEYKDAEIFVNALIDNSAQRLDGNELKRIKSTPFSAAEKVVSDCDSKGIEIICFDSEDYPRQLKEIYNPPAVLFCKGSFDNIIDSFVIGISGSREPADYSRKITDAICLRLGEKGCIIASGLSDGVDRLAATAATVSDNKAFIVCGQPIDGYSDPELMERIAKTGCVISETCTALNIMRPKFYQRNRILAAFIDALIYVEGSAVSRGLELCDTVLGMGKPVFVVPPYDITDNDFAGQAMLIRRGCIPFFSERDVLFYLARGYVDRFEYEKEDLTYLSVSDTSMMTDEEPEQRPQKQNRKPKPAGKEQPASNKSKTKDHSMLEGIRREICDALENGPLLADAIAAGIEADVSDVLTQLTMLELDGFVESLPGKQYGLI